MADALFGAVDTTEFSDDLRHADVEPLETFLRARLGELAEAQEPGDARWAVERLAEVTAAACVTLTDNISAWETVLTEGRTEEKGATQTLRQDLRFGWNELTKTASRFVGHADHQPHWRARRYLCAQHAEFVEQDLQEETEHPGL
ncbi:hypothetical protein ACWD4X_24710 [Streptomyces termitum]